MIGALVIHSQGTPECPPVFDDPQTGKHTDGAFKGTWWFSPEGSVKNTIYLPQRDRTVEIYATINKDQEIDWEQHMASWDVSDSQTQYEKLDNLRFELPDAVDNASIHMKYNTNSLGTWSIIRKSANPIYMYGLSNERTVYLLWSTSDIAHSIRFLDPGRYSLFRFPFSWQVFLNTQAICSKWWRWSSKFGPDTLRMFNALEVMLLKAR